MNAIRTTKTRAIAVLLLAAPALANAQRFTDASNNLPASAGGANMDVRAADLDNDGDLDLVFAREFQANFLLRNNGAGVFTNATSGNLPPVVNDSEDVAIADFNSDGHLDLVFCSEDDLTHEYYLGDGTGKFTAATFQFPNSEANAVIVSDINSDGFPDVFFGNKGTVTTFINDQTGVFQSANERVTQIQRTTQDLAQADVDGDGDLDLMAGNEDGNLLFINDGTGNFHDSTSTHLPGGLNVETRKLAFGDVDNDGDHDVFWANVAFIPGKNPQNRLLLNDGNGHFADATATHLPIDQDLTIDAIFEDLDLDTDLDLVLANVFGAPIRAYANDGTGVFADSTLAFFGDEYQRDALGVIAADLNADGFRDLYFCHRRMPGNNQKDLLLLHKPAVSVAEPAQKTAALQVYPNPVEGNFWIKTALKNLDSAQIATLDGRIIGVAALQKIANDTYLCAYAWPTEAPQGTYMLTVFAEGAQVASTQIHH